MSIPKTTPFTLKRIVEGIQSDSIPNDGFGDKPKQLTSEQKKKLMEMASMFESYGEALRNEEAIVNSSRGLTELCELAEMYAMNECGDVFQKNIVDKDMKEVKKRVQEYNKVAKECYARMQQLGVMYEDIGHTLGRYYDLNPRMGGSGTGQPMPQAAGKQPLQNEDMERICAWCQKSMGPAAGSGAGQTHGICQNCLGDMKAGTWQPKKEEEPVKDNPVSAPVSAPVSEDAGKPMYENLWNKFRSGGTVKPSQTPSKP